MTVFVLASAFTNLRRYATDSFILTFNPSTRCNSKRGCRVCGSFLCSCSLSFRTFPKVRLQVCYLTIGQLDWCIYECNLVGGSLGGLLIIFTFLRLLYRCTNLLASLFLLPNLEKHLFFNFFTISFYRYI